jgi:hypothetical protein
VAAGQKLGELIVCQEETEISRCDLVAKEAVPRGTLLQQMGEIFEEIGQLERWPL